MMASLAPALASASSVLGHGGRRLSPLFSSRYAASSAARCGAVGAWRSFLHHFSTTAASSAATGQRRTASASSRAAASCRSFCAHSFAAVRMSVATSAASPSEPTHVASSASRSKVAACAARASSVASRKSVGTCHANGVWRRRRSRRVARAMRERRWQRA